jgi:hypothetical protein
MVSLQSRKNHPSALAKPKPHPRDPIHAPPFHNHLVTVLEVRDAVGLHVQENVLRDLALEEAGYAGVLAFGVAAL